MTRLFPLLLLAVAALGLAACVARTGPTAGPVAGDAAPIRNPAHLSGDPTHTDPGVPRPGMQPPGVGVTPALLGPRVP